VCATLAQAELVRGRTAAAAEAAEQSLRLEPFHDGAWRALIAAYHAAGDRVSSERASRRYDTLLDSLSGAG
ncbi:BTAD domain-containing putative transcriptional regulator, partial [Kitasatospora nipponensis]|uniref:BTAD domain-containing putative transcriptional regulator n=1 Tax=Kitasatospora nipponensis TaxID=258049 RepID=UPI0031CDDBA5